MPLIEPIFAWNFPLVTLIYLKRSLVFSILLFSLFLCTDHWGRLSYTSQDGGVEGRALIFSCKSSKITTCCWTAVDRKMLNPAKKKDTLHPRAMEKPQQDGRRGKIVFRIKPHAHQRCLEGSNKTLCSPGDPTESEPDLPLHVWVSPAEVWGSECSRPGYGISLLRGGRH